MEPALQSGQIVVGWKRPVSTGDIVLARQVGREVVKRVKSVDGDKFYLVGDNSDASNDSRHYGPVAFSDIIGSMTIKLPKAVNPPKLVKPYGVWFGRAAAAILALMAVVHLFRIDTFIPILDNALPGGSTAAAWIAVLIVLTEVFAIPFALRMKLSPLAQLKSGALIVFAPLWWMLISIWSYGESASTGQLGEFVATPSDATLVTLNLAWVALSYATLWLLGYNSFKLSNLLKK